MNRKVILKIIAVIAVLTIIGYSIPVFGFYKDETVYSKLDATGNNYKTIVSTHIKNTESEDMIEDISDLLNIKNTRGDESFSQEGNCFSWNANKNDIYYQGESSKELPIKCNVKYELDGKEISKDDIVGKSGNVKILLQYINNEQKVVNINGQNTKMYVPFLVVAGTIINNDHNKNINVTNGKIIDDGTKTFVVGMAMPGLKDSLGLTDNEIDIPSNIEISMDATDFESNSILSYVTPKIIEKDDLKIFNKMDEIYSKVSILQDSMNKIQKGVNNLSEGTELYKEKSQKFYGAMKQISEGVSSVNSNYSQVYNGIAIVNSGITGISEGTQELNNGIKLLSSKLGVLPDNVYNLYKGSTELENGIDEISKGVTKLETNLTNTVTDLAETNSKLQATVDALKAAGYTDDNTLIKESNTKIQQNINKIKEINSNESKAKIKELNDGIDSSLTGAKNINKGLQSLDNSAKDLPDQLSKLSSGSDKLENGSKNLLSGTNTLSKGSTAFKNGIQVLDKSTQSLRDADEQLTAGAETLSNGSLKLKEGISQFNEQGIEKICNYINGDAKDLTVRIDKLKELSEEYNNFTLIDNKNEGNVKFILIIDSLKKQESENKENAILEQNIIDKED